MDEYGHRRVYICVYIYIHTQRLGSRNLTLLLVVRKGWTRKRKQEFTTWRYRDNGKENGSYDLGSQGFIELYGYRAKLAMNDSRLIGNGRDN